MWIHKYRDVCHFVDKKCEERVYNWTHQDMTKSLYNHLLTISHSTQTKMSNTRKPGGGASPCAACKLLRRRCGEDCVFAPYFPADEPHKFANVHKVFGASNVNKMLQVS